MTNLVRAGLARLTAKPYRPMPTVYDGLFPNGTLLTAPTRRAQVPPEAEPVAVAAASPEHPE